MQDMIISVVQPFAEPLSQANFVVFRNEQSAVTVEEDAIYLKKCKHYAKEHNCFLVTELIRICDFLALCMFYPNGKICAAQRAIFLAEERRIAYKDSGHLALFDTPFGKVFLCVDVDVYRPEVQRMARLKGCQIMVCSQYFAENANAEHLLFCGAWGAAQTNNLLVIAANNQNAAICAPFLACPDNSGFLATPKNHVSTTFQVSHLEDLHSDYLSRNFNDALFCAHRSLL